MLNYIYMDDLPLFTYIIYFFIGYGFTLYSHNIGLEKFSVRTLPYWFYCILYFVGNLAMLSVMSLMKTHLGLYFLANIVLPYAALWRSFPAEKS